MHIQSGKDILYTTHKLQKYQNMQQCDLILLTHLIWYLEVYTHDVWTYFWQTHQTLIMIILVWPCKLKRMKPSWSLPSELTWVFTCIQEEFFLWTSSGPLCRTHLDSLPYHLFVFSPSCVSVCVWLFQISFHVRRVRRRTYQLHNQL